MLKKIRDRNKKFKAADRMTQRVMIAEDVLEQIGAQQLIPTNGTYAARSNWNSSCNVCALGALAVSVMDGEALGIGPREMRSGLSPYFSADELELIEALFEGWKLEPDDRDTILHCYRWQTDGPRDRLIAIMENIVENDGELRLASLAPNLRWSRS